MFYNTSIKYTYHSCHTFNGQTFDLDIQSTLGCFEIEMLKLSASICDCFRGLNAHGEKYLQTHIFLTCIKVETYPKKALKIFRRKWLC